ncbi:RluA family pseudouridine synthase [Entomospira nematocerorum]|uniref:RluA family pseudouridine synthase n=1 Tax=Entomospira nematocerorum TaxID=2719987 RepID=A0A968GCY9_9SPIO|nr:RluA family pseudouridine synthase [Entomospira nematocera]NIZ47555.1 RluA family pseudouridine synthase [Entomospira nematocera]WDI33905.1 RluA family pseudouridine synthase [Entomospira nematocera]
MKPSKDSTPVITYVITSDDVNKRLDVIARVVFPFLQLSQIFQAIRKGVIRVNHQKSKGNVRLIMHDTISYHGVIPEDITKVPEKTSSKVFLSPKINPRMQTEYQHLDILLETSDIVIINKPTSWISHGSPPALTSWLQWKYGTTQSVSFNMSPVHRLDVGTSGANILAKTISGARTASDLLQQHRIKKIYLAIVEGKLEHSIHSSVYLDRINKKTFVSSYASSISSKQAITTIHPLVSTAQYSLVACLIETGRTHQIRAVTAYHHYPLVGDMLYNTPMRARTSSNNQQYFLHCYLLIDESQSLFNTIKAPLPDAFIREMKNLDIFITPSQLLNICTQLL